MALQVSTPTREFIIKKKNAKENILLKDPHPDMTEQEVIAFYKPNYPELATASIDGPVMKEDKAVYSFNTVIGTHG